ncbi:MAG: RES family NAD+ phosphorylase [Actinomycetota bacterium]|nr:RES family NAD+ phosphorylase [Actinomycetota bacterium]
MEYDRNLLSRIEQAETLEFHGAAWRVTYLGFPPSRANILGARWNPKDVGALYLSTTLECALAEFDYRHRAQPIPPPLDWQSHEFRVDLTRVVDFSNMTQLKKLGLEVERAPEGLAGYGPFQSIGGGAALLHFEAMIVPSLRFKGLNIVVFTANVEAGSASALSLVASRPAIPPS